MVVIFVFAGVGDLFANVMVVCGHSEAFEGRVSSLDRAPGAVNSRLKSNADSTTDLALYVIVSAVESWGWVFIGFRWLQIEDGVVHVVDVPFRQCIDRFFSDSFLVLVREVVCFLIDVGLDESEWERVVRFVSIMFNWPGMLFRL